MELVHKHIILRIEANKAPTVDELAPWVKQLIEKIGMKILAGPISADVTTIPGNCGPTCVCIIETSHIACHVWNESDPALIQLDVYTCGPFDPNVVIEHIKVWDPVKIEYKYLDREHGLNLIDFEQQS
jgi:S-adenosylmethionine/arginine decarboxylase-like enzyme